MSKLVPLLLVLLIGALAWQAVETANLRGDLRRLDDDTTTLQAAVGDLGRRVRKIDGRSPEPSLRSEAAGDLSAALPGGDDGAHLLPRGADPEVIARAVRDLQSRVSEQEARVQGVEDKVDESGSNRRSFPFTPPIRNLDQAQTRLDLSGSQRADLERIIEYGKRDLEDLQNLPNADGKTWKDIQTTNSTTTDSGITMVMTNLAEVMKYRDTKIPGSDETYGQAEQRIRGRAKQEVRDVLTPEQQATWDKSRANDLLGHGGAGMGAVSIMTTTSVMESDDED